MMTDERPVGLAQMRGGPINEFKSSAVLPPSMDSEPGLASESQKRNLSTAPEMRISSSLKARKRTKTGCLTCRKRRIKCGEERPTCSNCVKSKRSCEGYTPRVVFKDPLNAFRSTGGTIPQNGGLQDQLVSSHNSAATQYGRPHSMTAGPNLLPAILPRPSTHEGRTDSSAISSSIYDSGTLGDSSNCYGNALPEETYVSEQESSRAPTFTQGQYDASTATPGNADSGMVTPISTIASTRPILLNRSTSDSNMTSFMPYQAPPSVGPPSYPTLADVANRRSSNGAPFRSSSYELGPKEPLASRNGREYYDLTREATRNSFAQGDRRPTILSPSSLATNHSDLASITGDSRTWQDRRQFPNPTLFNGLNYSTTEQSQLQTPYDRMSEQAVSFTSSKLLAPPPPSIPIGDLEEQDDGLYDVDTEDEEDEDGESLPLETSHATNLPQSDLGLMLALSATQNGRSQRSITTFLNEPGVLATYRPSFTASPLMDSKTARVFCHFVTATGPTISIHERCPINPSLMFTGAPVPSSQQALWTYILPMMALSHQGLLHSMLALGSLHIARLQQTTTAPSLKHYHYALRRIAKAVSLPTKRQNIETLAATLILSFYEVASAEHTKWNSHLAGARQLIKELDLASMAIKTRAWKTRKRERQTETHYNGSTYYSQPLSDYQQSVDMLLEKDQEVDDDLISKIMGWKVSFEQLGRVDEAPEYAKTNPTPLTVKDIEVYHIQSDLFWWSCKQDMIQSLISGNRLLLPYERWSHCPPRACVGRLDAVYGTMDHLILLVSRIADFASKDLARKRKAAEANGGQWRAPGSARTQQSNLRGNGPFNQSLGQGPPQGFGMIPNPSPVQMPEAFAPDVFTRAQRQHVRYTFQSDEEIELESATFTAEAEWSEISHALDIFERSVGTDFQALSPEHMPPLSTPFGPALYYRSYSVSAVWALFYTGRILAARVHPSMPPSAVVAAGIAAPRTAEWANTIGRINAGIQPFATEGTVNPTLAAACIEATLSAFFAGVQYRDAAQRAWTVTKLNEIARLTGFQSSTLIAAGCEVTWIKQHEAGRGPPWQRMTETIATHRDDRLTGRRPWEEDTPPTDNLDRRFIAVNAGARLHWAMGIMSVEEDMRNINLSK